MGKTRLSFIRIEFTQIRNKFGLRILAFLLVILLSACMPLSFDDFQPTATIPPTGTKVVLPATWTQAPQTPTATASITPTITLSPTITPTVTATYTQTVTNTPEPVSLEPTPTVDWSTARLPDCTFTASKPGVRIRTAPFVDPYHVLPTMEPGKPYSAVITKPTYTLLVENGEPLGWIDYRLVVLSFEGVDCLSDYDQREFWDFPLCFFTPLGDIYGYTRSDFSEPMHTLGPDMILVVLNQGEDYYFTAYGSSGPSFVVKKEEVEIHGNCDDIPTLAKANTVTSLYSDLPDQGGTIVYTLMVDEPVYMQSQRKSGPPPPGIEGSGEWILVRRHSWAEDINGWVWSAHIEE